MISSSTALGPVTRVDRRTKTRRRVSVLADSFQQGLPLGNDGDGRIGKKKP
jgi:hypothetical protein